jgi:hypothetical protein
MHRHAYEKAGNELAIAVKSLAHAISWLAIVVALAARYVAQVRPKLFPPAENRHLRPSVKHFRLTLNN